MTKITFTKMQGIGNDYIYINLFEQPVSKPSEMADLLSDRHFGVGSDGLVLIGPSEQADFFMDMYNRDGSRGKMCGNAIRCVAKYVFDRGLTRKRTLRIETLSGIRDLKLKIDAGCVSEVTVDMGRPQLKPALIPVHWDNQYMIDEPVSVGTKLYRMTCVSMGNPHAVIFEKSIDQLDLEDLGPAFEHHTLFPEQTNTEFVQIMDRENLRMRVWERGSGETLACGTGACAVLTAAVLTGQSDRKALVHLKGGTLQIEWPADDAPVLMTGPAAFVFDGAIEIEID